MSLNDDQFIPAPHRFKKRRAWLVILTIIGLLFVIYAGYILYLANQIKKGELNLSPLPSNLATNVGVKTNFNVVTNDDPAHGSAGAPVTIVEFGDFECPFCRQAFPIVRQLLAESGDQVYLIYRDFPLRDIHPHAQKAAEAAECAADQGKFWAYHDRLFQNQEALTVSDLKRYARQVGLDANVFDQCLDSGRQAAEVEEDFQAGLAAGVQGTPTFFVNGQRIAGVLPLEVWRQIINELVKTPSSP